MPPCWRLLDYRMTGLHLNGLSLAEAAGWTTKKAETRPGRQESQYHGLEP